MASDSFKFIKAPLFLIQAVVPHMPEGGSITNISTGGTKTVLPAPIYVASKLALEGITMTLARELGAKGIRINTVSPGYTDTDMMHASGIPDVVKIGSEASALKRIGNSAPSVIFFRAHIWNNRNR